jgi:hypothetical protein
MRQWRSKNVAICVLKYFCYSSEVCAFVSFHCNYRITSRGIENVELPVYLASHFLYQATSIYLTRTRSQCKPTRSTKFLTSWTCRLKFAAVYWLVFIFIHSLVWTIRVLSEAARWNLPGIPMGVVTTTRQRAELAMATVEQVSTTSNLLLLLLLLLYNINVLISRH